MGALAEQGINESDLELLLSHELQPRAELPGTHALIVVRKRTLLTVTDVLDITSVNPSHNDFITIYSRILSDRKGYLITGNHPIPSKLLYSSYEERSKGAQKLLGYVCISNGTWIPIEHASWGITYGNKKFIWRTFASKNDKATQHQNQESLLLPVEY